MASSSTVPPTRPPKALDWNCREPKIAVNSSAAVIAIVTHRARRGNRP
ncbi:hypothetical protein ACSFA7_21360 [Variovorax sp. LT1R20]